jgi:SMC interacting uncharacterized protein involved in chromosome segregation
MAVMPMPPRKAWTDERLDDLNKKVDDGFREMREEFRALRGEMKGEFQAVRGEMKGEFQAVRGEMKGEFQTVRGEIQGVRDEISALSRNILQLTYGLVGTIFVGFLGTIVALVTQT